MTGESRKSSRVRLEHKHPVNLMGVDGTWRRSCVLLDVSATGAKIEVEGSIDVLRAREFFLLLSSTGLAFRRCELVWIDGAMAGVRFVKAKSAKHSQQAAKVQ
ncbi:PilZ domain-containing protein [Bradyrhizobium sp. ARR65]|uniref:PilZ domain-containing protein n=1 Tax=Bradyrhizobium sp. ARR65 TaxID=1040989 RepID=UPI000467115F|nr:PilZ domain-containing protein [Bradyrhizobium sp. ARR65]